MFDVITFGEHNALIGTTGLKVTGYCLTAAGVAAHVADPENVKNMSIPVTGLILMAVGGLMESCLTKSYVFYDKYHIKLLNELEHATDEKALTSIKQKQKKKIEEDNEYS